MPARGYTSPYRQPIPVANASVERRARFIVSAYNHLFLAIVAFAAIEVFLFTTGLVTPIVAVLTRSWLLALGGFILVGWLARSLAHGAQSRTAQYAGLGAMVVAQAIVFAPLLYIANRSFPGTIQSAGIVTMLGFAGLTAVAFVTRRDFSFLRGLLMWGGICALALIVAASLFGFQLGVLFSVAMIALAGASVLYDTSNVLHHYSEDRPVAAALELFASISLLFWYVLRLFMSGRN